MPGNNPVWRVFQPVSVTKPDFQRNSAILRVFQSKNSKISLFFKYFLKQKNQLKDNFSPKTAPCPEF
ncbi:MAG: hypothetical protein A2234_03180 [Elusimicrobia bacterium RIFOXYA2_FULL_58_8]|nr:MAG: hypothetical protein A2285_00565 [Elusimicrobia bacterium RIFOXYA12_FULL_57_11]OGS17254.1 MAG: hypothetical protein A2234_03180 [Elusimicrobia bacterium RIFOXYA2_FULL_58_8]